MQQQQYATSLKRDQHKLSRDSINTYKYSLKKFHDRLTNFLD